MILSSALLLVSTATLRQVFPPDKSYTVQVPEAWVLAYDWDGPEPGMEARSPDGSGTLGVRFYPADKSEFATPEAYLERTGAPRESVPISSRVASRVVTESRFPPPPGKQGPDLVLRRTRVVLPAEKGFYVLMLDEPQEGDAEAQDAYRRLLQSFKLKHPARKPLRPQ